MTLSDCFSVSHSLLSETVLDVNRIRTAENHPTQMTAGGAIPLRKVHARALCDEGSVCARLINKPGLGGVLDGGEESKPSGMMSSL